MATQNHTLSLWPIDVSAILFVPTSVPGQGLTLKKHANKMNPKGAMTPFMYCNAIAESTYDSAL